MEIRRVVTGHAADGAATFVSDGAVPATHVFRNVPGFANALVWSAEPGAPIPRAGTDPTASVKSIVPAPGGTRFLIVRFPPDAVFGSPGFDPAAAGAETAAALPGLAETFEHADPAMHTTETIDYGVVLDGEVWLELDKGETRHLTRGDVIVQNGTRHAWRNRSSNPVTMAFVLVGARR